MTHLGLFEGIGGFSLAARWMGWETLAWCEWNEFGQKVLRHHFPEAEGFGDITKTNFTKYANKIDILTGGFPCQDASIAKQDGKGQSGLDGSRTGLWREMVRAIEEVKPKFIVAENVENILRTNDGRDFATILGELVRMGFNCEWRVCRASEVGGCHHRARCFMVAYSNGIRLQPRQSFFKNVLEETLQKRRIFAGTSASVGISWSIEPSVSFVDDGLSERLDNITFSKWRNESIKAGGNAIVPQVAYQIFKAIEEYNNLTK
jgi:DNA (cytosine-5)-methyltransferase 1